MYFASNSVRTARCPDRGYQRGLVINSGFVMLARGKGECLMSYMTQVNMAGWMPVAMVEYALEQQVLRVVTRMRQHFIERERQIAAAAASRVFSIQDEPGPA